MHGFIHVTQPVHDKIGNPTDPRRVSDQRLPAMPAMPGRPHHQLRG